MASRLSGESVDWRTPQQATLYEVQRRERGGRVFGRLTSVSFKQNHQQIQFQN